MKKIIKLTESDLYRIIKRVISEQDPRDPIGEPRRQLMNRGWYLSKIKNIFDGMMEQFNLKHIKDLQSFFYPGGPNNEQTFKNFYCLRLGQLISPNSLPNEQIKLGEDFFYGAARAEPLITKGGEITKIDNLIRYVQSETSGGFQKAADLLRREIKKNEKTAAPSN